MTMDQAGINAVILVCLFFGACADDDACPSTPCPHMLKEFRQYPFFNMNGQQLPNAAKVLLVPATNVSSCYINVTELISSYNFGSSPLVATTVITCIEKLRIHLTPYEGLPRYDNAISYLQITNCSYSMEDVENFAQTSDLRVYTSIKSDSLEMPCSNTTNATQCDGLKNIVSFSFQNVEDPPTNLSQMFACQNVFLEMAEVQFSDMAWTQLPSELRTKFPNLQALEVQNNNFTIPPDFPWTDGDMHLPRNLSRSDFFQTHYSQSFNLNISPSIFRRILTLDNNQIRSLTNVTFKGYLHMITIRQNNLSELGNDTFVGLTGLQTLDLSLNALTSIPVGTFRGLSELRHLNLGENKISYIDSMTLNHLTSLEYLNLAGNMLTSLEDGVFSNLLNLEKIDLSRNQLSVIPPDSFPLPSTSLKYIILDSNPLTEIPEFVFWIRNLKVADLKNTNITLSNFTGYILQMDTHRLIEAVVESVSEPDPDFDKKPDELRIIDLSYSKVEHIQLPNYLPKFEPVIKLLLLHFKFVFEGCPLLCNCDVGPLNGVIHKMLQSRIIEEDEYFFKDWKCQAPSELQGRMMVNVKPEETYCLVDLELCPFKCECHMRSVVNVTIVDCRNQNLTQLHETLPTGPLEMWYSGNQIERISWKEYLRSVVSLDVSGNKVTQIDPNIFSRMPKLKRLNVQSNTLTYLPKDIQSLRMYNISIQHNSFICDCQSLWMKGWIFRNRANLSLWRSISCNTVESKGKEIISLSDSEFVCRENFDSVRHITTAIVVSSVVVLVLVALVVITYAYRLECKVLLYIYLGWHPFDNDVADAGEKIDCVLIHSGNLTNWVMENVVDVLEGKDYNFVVVDMARDFVLGFSFQENLSRVVRHSKRMILVISNDWKEEDRSFKLAWNIAQEKIKETKSNYGIIINHESDVSKIRDKELRKFIARRRFIDTQRLLFMEKLLYSMPQKIEASRRIQREAAGRQNENKDGPRCFIHSAYGVVNVKGGREELNDVIKCHAFVSYSDGDTGYVTNDLQPRLEKEGYSLCIPDRDFIPGASKEDNILSAINVSLRTIFVLSSNFLQDEWSLFVFRTAYEKSLREKTNHLLVIVLDEVDLQMVDKEIRQYVDSYICLNTTDVWFWQKLFNGLPMIGGGARHTSPLFMTQLSYENPAFETVAETDDEETEEEHQNTDLDDVIIALQDKKDGGRNVNGERINEDAKMPMVEIDLGDK